LWQALEGADARVREEAIDSLARTPPEGVAACLDSVNWRGREGLVDAIERGGTAGLPALMAIARSHGKRDARRYAVRAMGRVADGTWCDSLRVFLDSGARGLALDALGRTGSCDPGWIRPFLDDSDPDVRRRALIAYAACGADDALGAALARLGDTHHGVRTAAEGIVREAGEIVGDLLVEEATRGRRPGRVVAMRLLGEMGILNGRDALRAALAHEDWSIRVAAALALARMDDMGGLDIVRDALRRESQPAARARLLAAQARMLSGHRESR